jgi:hypothetical protein
MSFQSISEQFRICIDEPMNYESETTLPVAMRLVFQIHPRDEAARFVECGRCEKFLEETQSKKDEIEKAKSLGIARWEDSEVKCVLQVRWKCGSASYFPRIFLILLWNHFFHTSTQAFHR